MAQANQKKPLGAWPDQKKHEEAQPLEEKDSETALGHEPASGSDEVGDVDKIAESMGIYDIEEETSDNPKDEEEDPVEEVGIAEQIKRNTQK